MPDFRSQVYELINALKDENLNFKSKCTFSFCVSFFSTTPEALRNHYNKRKRNQWILAPNPGKPKLLLNEQEDEIVNLIKSYNANKPIVKLNLASMIEEKFGFPVSGQSINNMRREKDIKIVSALSMVYTTS